MLGPWIRALDPSRKRVYAYTAAAVAVAGITAGVVGGGAALSSAQPGPELVAATVSAHSAPDGVTASSPSQPSPNQPSPQLTLPHLVIPRPTGPTAKVAVKSAAHPVAASAHPKPLAKPSDKPASRPTANPTPAASRPQPTAAKPANSKPAKPAAVQASAIEFPGAPKTGAHATAASNQRTTSAVTTDSATQPSLGKAACASGSSVENGLHAAGITIHRVVCQLWPQISVFYGLRAGDTGSEHSSGHAIDIMCSGQLGFEVSRYLQRHAYALGVTQLIYQQHIWTTQRAGEGWRAMADRGSVTANHFDHVHVTFG